MPLQITRHQNGCLKGSNDSCAGNFFSYFLVQSKGRSVLLVRSSTAVVRMIRNVDFVLMHNLKCIVIWIKSYAKIKYCVIPLFYPPVSFLRWKTSNECVKIRSLIFDLLSYFFLVILSYPLLFSSTNCCVVAEDLYVCISAWCLIKSTVESLYVQCTEQHQMNIEGCFGTTLVFVEVVGVFFYKGTEGEEGKVEKEWNFLRLQDLNFLLRFFFDVLLSKKNCFPNFVVFMSVYLVVFHENLNY